jgi:hypothetical protein
MHTPMIVPDLSDPRRADVEVPATQTGELMPLAGIINTVRGDLQICSPMCVPDLSNPRRANVGAPAIRNR